MPAREVRAESRSTAMLDVERDSDLRIGEVESGGVDWREVDRQLRRIARRRAALDAEEARWLRMAQRAEVHRHVGCGSFAEYVERVLGHTPRACAERMRVAGALEALPRMEGALAGGGLAYSAVRELTRVVTPETEAVWIEAARGKTVHEVEAMVSGRRPGDRPEDPPDPELQPQVLRFEVMPETYARFLDAMARLRRKLGRMVSDDEAIDEMARAVLADDSDAEGVESNTPPYQVALTVCEKCDRAWQDGGGRSIEVGPEIAAIARCDAQTIGRVNGNTRTRATRTIPPALRRQVMRRDHGRCIVPGCRASRWIEVHHINERSRGGRNEASNLACACASHHAAVHRGLLSITGEPGAWRFWSADGSPWGATPIAPTRVAGPAPTIAPTRVAGPVPTSAPMRVSAPDHGAVRSALCKLGFKPAEAASAVAHALTHADAHETVEDLLRAALRACPRPAT